MMNNNSALVRVGGANSGVSAWNPDEIEMLDQLKRICTYNMYVQSSSAQICDRLNSFLTIPNIVLGGVMSVTIFSSKGVINMLFNGILAVFSTILSSLIKHIGAGERAQQHCFAVKEYHSIVRKIDVNVLYDGGEFVDRESFIRDVQGEIDRLYMVQPDPIWLALRWFEQKYKKGLDEALVFPEVERYAARVVGRASKAPATRLIEAGTGGGPAVMRRSATISSPTGAGGRGFSKYFESTGLSAKVLNTAGRVSNNGGSGEGVSTHPLQRKRSFKFGKVVVGYGGYASDGMPTRESTELPASDSGGQRLSDDGSIANLKSVALLQTSRSYDPEAAVSIDITGIKQMMGSNLLGPNSVRMSIEEGNEETSSNA
jgi:hypothetical protein